MKRPLTLKQKQYLMLNMNKTGMNKRTGGNNRLNSSIIHMQDDSKETRIGEKINTALLFREKMNPYIEDKEFYHKRNVVAKGSIG